MHERGTPHGKPSESLSRPVRPSCCIARWTMVPQQRQRPRGQTNAPRPRRRREADMPRHLTRPHCPARRQHNAGLQPCTLRRGHPLPAPSVSAGHTHTPISPIPNSQRPPLARLSTAVSVLVLCLHKSHGQGSVKASECARGGREGQPAAKPWTSAPRACNNTTPRRRRHHGQEGVAHRRQARLPLAL